MALLGICIHPGVLQTRFHLRETAANMVESEARYYDVLPGRQVGSGLGVWARTEGLESHTGRK